MVGVIRAGAATTVNVKELVVGDVCRLNAGDKIPADGLLIAGSDVVCNESALTGESEDKRKCNKPFSEGGDMFLISGATISSGCCTMLVTAVGENSRWGRTRAKLTQESEDTPLQEKLDILAGQIGQLGMGMAAATFLAMMTIWFLYPASRHEGVTVFDYMLKAFIMAVTIVVVAVPEGLPLAVTLSLAYSTQKMMHDNNLIRVLAACETMGNATNICSDKTGTLTQNRMTVVQLWHGNAHYDGTSSGKHLPKDADYHQKNLQLITTGISCNSTCELLYNVDTTRNGNAARPAESNVKPGEPVVNGNATEGALLLYLRNSLQKDYTSVRKAELNVNRGDRMFTFSSAKKSMTTLVLDNENRAIGVVYVKGAAEVIVRRYDL
jgi:P-type E1-E2 ATPase